MPRRDAIERALGVVDYVLVEGLGTRDWRELVRRDWRTAIVLVGSLTNLKLFHLLIRAAGLYYRLRYGINFKGDMRYVAELAERVGKRVEIVDEDLLSIYEKSREAFKPRLTSILGVLLFGIVVGLVVLGLLVGVVEFLAGHYKQATISLAPTVLGIVTILLILANGFINATKTIRDRKLINRVRELINQGHKVLVVRGKLHVKYIVNELRRRGIECEDLS
jgi:flagellar biosynthesis protein FliQ